MRTIAVINQKGGVGKTTTVANLGAALAARGRATCLIDLDPQAHLTLHLGVEPGRPAVSMYEVVSGEAPLASAALLIAPHLWLLPSVIDLAAAEMELVTTVGREQILHGRLADQPLPWEFVLIDCPPSLGLLTLNALAAADDMFIPLQAHFLALQGLGKLLETASLVHRRINPALRVSGVVLCMYEMHTRLAAEVVADLQDFFRAARDHQTPWSHTRIFRTPIRRNIKLAECPSYGRTIFDYEPSSRGAHDYNALAEEFLAWADGRPWQPAPDATPLTSDRTPRASEAPAEQGEQSVDRAEQAAAEEAPAAQPPRAGVDVPPPYPPAGEFAAPGARADEEAAQPAPEAHEEPPSGCPAREEPAAEPPDAAAVDEGTYAAEAAEQAPSPTAGQADDDPPQAQPPQADAPPAPSPP